MTVIADAPAGTRMIAAREINTALIVVDVISLFLLLRSDYARIVFSSRSAAINRTVLRAPRGLVIAPVGLLTWPSLFLDRRVEYRERLGSRQHSSIDEEYRSSIDPIGRSVRHVLLDLLDHGSGIEAFVESGLIETELSSPFLVLVYAETCLVPEERVVHCPVAALFAGAFCCFCGLLCQRMETQREIPDDDLDLACLDILLIDLWVGLLKVPSAKWALIVGELHLLGIRLATLFATTGALALGVGFALKGVVENWISGVILRVGQTIRPGDVVEIEGRWLKVKQIGMRTTDALAYKEEEVMIPSGIIAQSIPAGHLPTARQMATT